MNIFENSPNGREGDGLLPRKSRFSSMLRAVNSLVTTARFGKLEGRVAGNRRFLAKDINRIRHLHE